MSLNLKQAAGIGLDALSSLESHRPVSSSVQEQQLDTLKKLKAPEAVLLNAIVPGVEQLVQASNR
jgi:hypothetical protein